MRLRGMLFDYGGTLDGAASHWLDRFRALYRAVGVDRPPAAVREAFDRADAAAYATAAVAQMSLPELMDFHVGVQLESLGLADIALRRRLAGTFVTDCETALAGSRRVLARLAQHYRLGVVSNFYGNVERILADAGIAALLCVVADSNRVGFMKPDRRIFEHALRALGVEPEAAMYVGDSYERDIRPARALGLRTAWLVADSASAAGADQPADLVVGSLDELTAAVLPAGDSKGKPE